MISRPQTKQISGAAANAFASGSTSRRKAPHNRDGPMPSITVKRRKVGVFLKPENALY
jgi:hypothetical protein